MRKGSGGLDWTVPQARALHGEIVLPGDKSIGHRSLLLAALAEGVSELAGLPQGADVLSTARAIAALGVTVERAAEEDNAARVAGKGLHGLEAASSAIDCGNSGTTMRLLAGILAGQTFESILSGDRSLQSRPMRRIAEPLRAMGVTFETAGGGTAPLRISGTKRPLRAIIHRPQVASAQVKSCVLLAGLYADGETSVEEPLPTRDHSERLLRAMGARVDVTPAGSGQLVSVQPEPLLQPLHGRIPADVSSASYWLVAASLCPGSALTLPRVGLNPSRSAIVEVLQSWGASIEIRDRGEWCGEPFGTLEVRGSGGEISGGRITAERVPALIDELPLLAALGPFTRSGVEILGAGELRVKESDRIAAIAAALRALGAEVDEFPDGLAVAGETGLDGGVVNALGDHRIALAMGAVAVAAKGPVTVSGAEAMSISYPDFSATLVEVASG
jgi:3-phosphoshikimate 1-carboxyvinyltransferase